MPNEKGEAEETAVDESQEQTPAESKSETPAEESQDDSQVEKTEESGGGDLRVALKEERQKRQDLEAKLKDPNFVYQAAEELGLTQEQTEQAAAQAEASPQPVQQQPVDVWRLTQEAVAFDKQLSEFAPAKDPEVMSMIDTYVAQGMQPTKALAKVKSQFQKLVASAQKEDAQKKEAEENDQNQAQTASSVNTSSDAEEIQDLIEKSKSYDPSVQKEAQIELLKRRNKEQGIA